MLKRFKQIIFSATVALALSAIPALAADTCGSLTSLKLNDGKITSASIVEAGQFKPPAGGFMMGGPGEMAVFKNTPAFCRVQATLTPTSDSDIKVEVWMPRDNWNGKLAGIGNGVWAGTISHSALAEPLSRGYATVATDTGHTGMGIDAKWAIGHKEKLIDFGYRAVHEMTVKAKEILTAYYGKKENTALWVSCSTGGRQGLMEAYRYPEDLMASPRWLRQTPWSGLMIGSLWTGYAAMKDDAHRLPMPKLMTSNKAYIDKCDGIDGIRDGIVSWPEMCELRSRNCPMQGRGRNDCLTAPQVEALRDIYGGAKNPRTGEAYFSRL